MNKKYYKITFLSPSNNVIDSWTIFSEDLQVLMDFMKYCVNCFSLSGPSRVRIECMEVTE